MIFLESLMELKLVNLDTLIRIFEEQTPENPVLIQKICSDCACDVTIEIHRTSGGFGIQGGALYDEDGIIVAKCVDCYSDSK